MSVRFHPAARTDLLEARAWYEERSPLSAVGFARDVARAVRLIAEAPHRHPQAGHGTRRFVLRGDFRLACSTARLTTRWRSLRWPITSANQATGPVDESGLTRVCR
ncbi:MAG: type II toxin-antitoxin system RelE/ParE family toxin [Acidobacteria bacterium]|nr:MAG: type II toxin-antitoxin system RelE/ParE family toxin [Acidobacteriota bacterium]